MRMKGWHGAPARSRFLPAEASNRRLTNLSFCSTLGGDELNRRLRNLVEGRESLGVGFVSLLRNDQV
jgi:hypothetical protein